MAVTERVTRAFSLALRTEAVAMLLSPLEEFTMTGVTTGVSMRKMYGRRSVAIADGEGNIRVRGRVMED